MKSFNFVCGKCGKLIKVPPKHICHEDETGPFGIVVGKEN